MLAVPVSVKEYLSEGTTVSFVESETGRAMLRDLYLYAPDSFSVGVPDEGAVTPRIDISLKEGAPKAVSENIPPKSPYVWVMESEYRVTYIDGAVDTVANTQFVPRLLKYSDTAQISSAIWRDIAEQRREWHHGNLFPLILAYLRKR